MWGGKGGDHIAPHLRCKAAKGRYSPRAFRTAGRSEQTMFISEAWAQGAGGGSDFLVQLFPLVLIFIVFYFLLIRPQQSKMKAQREMLSGVKRGDRVVTGGGIIGLVTKVIGDNELQVEVAEGVRVRILKQTITDIITRGESVRGGKETDEDDKPMLPATQPAAERKSLLGSLFGGKK